MLVFGGVSMMNLFVITFRVTAVSWNNEAFCERCQYNRIPFLKVFNRKIASNTLSSLAMRPFSRCPQRPMVAGVKRRSRDPWRSRQEWGLGETNKKPGCASWASFLWKNVHQVHFHPELSDHVFGGSFDGETTRSWGWMRQRQQCHLPGTVIKTHSCRECTPCFKTHQAHQEIFWKRQA